jgi:glycosyltransferase involved in cell wall biosynthesis
LRISAAPVFGEEIMPSILEQLPDSVLHIVGSKMPESILALASKSLIAHGYVEDVEPLFQSCLLSVAPLRFGAGVKGKINQSMSHWLPVISTSIGVEGMYLVHEENALIADDPIDFATQVVRLHRDATLWEKLSQNGLKNIEEHFSSAVAERSFVQLLKDLAAKTGAQRGA